ncbi:MAG: CapA family protein [Chloroflexi bacterium]|nr:CapA family protein [Chloroflexota bacterium]
MSDQASSKDTVLIHAVGDVFPRRVEAGEPPESLMEKVSGKIKEADVAVCQLETNLSTKGCLQYRDFPTWYGRNHPDNVKCLVSAGFKVVSHASNHCFDYGPDSLIETVEVLRKANLLPIGAGKDLAEARQPAIVERKGIKIGFLAYNMVLPAEYEAREGKAGCNPIRVSTYYEAQEYQAGTPPKVISIPLEGDVLAMEEAIRNLRKQVDVVVVVMHWGIHFVPGMLAMYQPTVGHRAIDAGADLIVGHHAHIIKGIEVYKGKAIFYSLGNFAQETPWHVKPPPGGAHSVNISSSYRKFEEEPGWDRYKGPKDKRYTMMVRCVAGKKGVHRVSFLPGFINQKAEPELLSRSDPRFDEVLNYIGPFCKDLGTALSVEGDEVVVSSLP